MVKDKVIRCVYSEVDTVHERNHTANHSSKTSDKIVLQVLHDGSRGSLGWLQVLYFVQFIVSAARHNVRYVRGYKALIRRRAM